MSDVLDPELASVFINQALKAPDARWKIGPLGGWSEQTFFLQTQFSLCLRTACGTRINTYEGIDAKAPYIVWNVRDDPNGAVRSAKSRSGEIARKRAIVSVKRVDIFQSGKGTFGQARGSYRDLFGALVSVPCTPIYAGDDYLGAVTQTRWKSDIRTSVRDENSGVLVTNYGFELYVTYEPIQN